MGTGTLRKVIVGAVTSILILVFGLAGCSPSADVGIEDIASQEAVSTDAPTETAAPTITEAAEITTAIAGTDEPTAVVTETPTPTATIPQPAEFIALPRPPRDYMISFEANYRWVAGMDALGEVLDFDTYVMDAKGDYLNNLSQTWNLEWNLDISWDGSQVVFGQLNPDRGLYIANIDGSNPIYLVDGFLPKWSPDESQIVFRRSKTGHLFLINTDGTNEVKLTSGLGAGEVIQALWSPDGRYIAVIFEDRKEHLSLNLIYMADMRIIRLGETEGITELVWSPDSRYLSFMGGNRDVYLADIVTMTVTNINNNGTKSHEGSPAWSPNATRIAYAWAESLVDSPDVPNAIYLYDLQGNHNLLVDGLIGVDRLEWSPDGSKIVFTSTGENGISLYLVTADGSQTVNLSGENVFEEIRDIVWWPDSDGVSIVAKHNGGWSLYSALPDGTVFTQVRPLPDLDFPESQ